MTDHLRSIYRRLASQAETPDAEAVARLASGERDDAALLAIASSNAASDALAITLAGGDDSHALALGAWRAQSEARRAAGAVPARRVVLPLPWLAAAAAIAFGFAVMLKLSGPRELPQAPVAAAPAEPAGAQPLMRGDFEETAHVADSFEGDARPDLFSDDFDA